MQPQQNALIDTPPSTADTGESCGLLTQQLNEAEELTNELKRLLVRYESELDQEGIRPQVETLERWMESYRRGLSAARKISENGATLLQEMQQRLKLAAEELHRLEGEGGNPASKSQAAEAEAFLKASQRIEKVLPDIEHIFCATEEKSNA